MSEVVVVGRSRQPGKEAEARGVQGLVGPPRGGRLHPLRAAPGGRSLRLAFVERWESRELLDAHLQSPHVSAILERAEELFGDSADIVVYEPVPEGEERKGSLAAHAGG